MLYDPERQEQRGDSDRPLALYIVCVHSSFSRVRLFATPWTVARQAPLSMGFSRQEYWSGLLCPPAGDLPNQETEPTSLKSLHWQAGSLSLVPLFNQGVTVLDEDIFVSRVHS